MADRTSTDPDVRPTNRLSDAISPYLRQHQHNPVDWYPWGPEALARARDEDKPIFLSVGYATCFWCHVMARESFADPATAALMNEHFVNIKLDREERPDLDEVYMTATQLLTGQGGWPNSVFLTPRLEPYYTGTYFPPERRQGMPAFREVLESMAHAWEHRRADVRMQGEELAVAMRRYLEERGTPGPVPPRSVVDRARASLAEKFDPKHGGFGDTPKFPSHGNLLLLDALASHDAEAARMLDTTLDGMARGGLFDQLGGGFHRYTVDAGWKTPHFEKMLYDNGQLLTIYARAHARTGDPEWARVARATAAFLDRELRQPEGGFSSAIDAETDGFEGAFYVWTLRQITDVLGDEDAGFLAPLLGFDGPPSFEQDHYVFHRPTSLSDQASRRQLSRGELMARIEPLEERLFVARATRRRPITDDKVLTDWNGMAISGLAEASVALDAPHLLDWAEQAAAFVLTSLKPDHGLLHHVWRAGEARQPAFLSDYVHLIAGLLALDAATDASRWLEAAVALTEEQIERLGDTERGGFFAAAAAPDLIARSREIFDGALPATNAVATLNLLALAERTGDARWRREAERVLQAFGGLIEGQPEAARSFCVALGRFHDTTPAS